MCSDTLEVKKELCLVCYFWLKNELKISILCVFFDFSFSNVYITSSAFKANSVDDKQKKLVQIYNCHSPTQPQFKLGVTKYLVGPPTPGNLGS